jgi:hypothetical protein
MEEWEVRLEFGNALDEKCIGWKCGGARICEQQSETTGKATSAGAQANALEERDWRRRE